MASCRSSFTAFEGALDAAGAGPAFTCCSICCCCCRVIKAGPAVRRTAREKIRTVFMARLLLDQSVSLSERKRTRKLRRKRKKILSGFSGSHTVFFSLLFFLRSSAHLCVLCGEKIDPVNFYSADIIIIILSFLVFCSTRTRFIPRPSNARFSLIDSTVHTSQALISLI